MEYVVWVIEIAAEEFFNRDKTVAYDILKNSKLWDLYVDHYDVTHTLGAEYISIVTVYEFNINDLDILSFDGYTAEWLDFVGECLCFFAEVRCRYYR